MVTTTSNIPPGAEVISTAHKLGAIGELKRLVGHLGPAHHGGSAFDVLFVDEAWQLPHHLFDQVAKAAPVTVGVGDVGQLPPLEIGANPWRGDPGFNPYRAWPTAFDTDERTWAVELPAVWRPTAGEPRDQPTAAVQADVHLHGVTRSSAPATGPAAGSPAGSRRGRA